MRSVLVVAAKSLSGVVEMSPICYLHNLGYIKVVSKLKIESVYIMANLKMILMVVAGLVLIYSIFVFLPMLFTYISSGDVRPPEYEHKY